MALVPPLFKVPNTKRTSNNKVLPNLSIPPTSNNKNGNPNTKPSLLLNQNIINHDLQQHENLNPLSYQPQQLQHQQYQNPQGLKLSTSPSSVSSSKSTKRKPPPIDTKVVSHSPDMMDVDQQGSADESVNVDENEYSVKHHLEQLTPYDWHLIANANKIVEISSLGEGNGGAVTKCYIPQLPNKQIFALKLVMCDPNPDLQKQIFRELKWPRNANILIL